MSCAGPRINWQSPYREISSFEKGDIIHLPTGIKLTKEQMISMIDNSRIIYVGESHDNVCAHKVQLEILKALSELNPGKITVGMEMLKRPSQDIADQWTSGKLEEKEFVRTWVDDWSNDFEYYLDILRYIREHNIPLLALRASDEWTEKVKGSQAANEENEQDLPEMDVEDPYHRSHIKAIFDKHPGAGQDFEGFYKVQVLWDESMASSIYEYLTSKVGLDKQLLIFAGSQHIEHGFGVPRRVFRRLPLSYSIVLPIAVEPPPVGKHKLMHVSQPEVPLQSGDFAWAVGYEDLTDEKVYLGVMVHDAEDGVKILGIGKDSAAQEAGLKKGDIIKALDSEPIETPFDLTYFISLKNPGDKGTIEILRDEEPLSFEVTFKAGGFHM